MTVPNAAPTDLATAIPGAPLVTAEPDTELAQLAVEYDRLDAEVKAKTADLEALKARLKVALQERHPGESEVLLTAPGLVKPLKMWFQEKWTLDSKRLKNEAPEVWVRWAKKGGSWYFGRTR
jgi:hypothetical protein